MKLKHAVAFLAQLVAICSAIALFVLAAILVDLGLTMNIFIAALAYVLSCFVYVRIRRSMDKEKYRGKIRELEAELARLRPPPPDPVVVNSGHCSGK